MTRRQRTPEEQRAYRKELREKRKKLLEQTDNVLSFLDADKADAVPPNREFYVGRPGRSGESGKSRQPIYLGQRWSRIVQNVKDGVFTWDEFCENLTPKELVRGQLMGADGRFAGKPPSFVPRAFIHAAARELHKRFNEKMQENLLSATEELIKLGMDPTVEARDRIKVLQYVIERVVGKVPDKVEVHKADPWEDILFEIQREADAAAASKENPYAARMETGSEGR